MVVLQAGFEPAVLRFGYGGKNCTYPYSANRRATATLRHNKSEAQPTELLEQDGGDDESRTRVHN